MLYILNYIFEINIIYKFAKAWKIFIKVYRIKIKNKILLLYNLYYIISI